MKSFLCVLWLSMAYACLISCSDSIVYKDKNASVEDRVNDLLGRMTLEEKIAQLLHLHAGYTDAKGHLDTAELGRDIKGVSYGAIEAFTMGGRQCCSFMGEVAEYMKEHTRLGIPILCTTESLHGSAQDGSTIFPQAIALGSTFNVDLVGEVADAIAKELKAQNINQCLAPDVDVCLDLRWGRVEEGFGEDPFLNGKMGIAEVRSYMKNGISPVMKHFGAHGEPRGGLNLASVSCGERDLLNIHLKPFEDVIKHTDIMGIMSSYNSWNSVPNSSSSYLLTHLLRDKWNFQGYVYSDWGCIGMLDYFHHTAENGADAAKQALIAGVDLDAADDLYLELSNLVKHGYLDEKYIDIAVARVLRTKFKMGLFDNDISQVENYNNVVHCQDHINLAKKVSDEAIILLKNSNNLLPLNVDKISSIGLIGPNANQVQFGDYSWSRSNDDGVTILEAMQEKYPQIKVNYAKGCDINKWDSTGFNEALTAARKSEINIVVVGSTSASIARDYSNSTCGEGFDLSDLKLPGVQEELVRAIQRIGKPTILVLNSGKPYLLSWANDDIPAIIAMWYGGECGGYSLCDVIFGKVNPSGKLNYSYPKNMGNMPCYYNYLPSDRGYYNQPGTKEKPGRDYVFDKPGSLWCFGYGLSYTKFAYNSIQTDKDDYTVEDTLKVVFNLKNEGERRGKEVVQLYVRDLVSSVVTPIKQLKAFEKIDLKAGEMTSVTMKVPIDELALYDDDMKKVVEPGEFEIQIGASSEDIRLTKRICVEKAKMNHIPTKKEVETKEGVNGKKLINQEQAK